MTKNNLTDIQNQVVEVKADQINIRTDNLTKRYFNEIIEGATVTDRFNNLLKVYKEWKESREDFSLNEPINVIKQNLECILGALEQAERQGQAWADSSNRNVDFIGEQLDEFKSELKEHNELSIKVEELKQQLDNALAKGTEARDRLGEASAKIMVLEAENKALLKQSNELLEGKVEVAELKARVLELEKLNQDLSKIKLDQEKDLKDLKTKNQGKDKSITEKDKQIKELKAELEKLKKANTKTEIKKDTTK